MNNMYKDEIEKSVSELKREFNLNFKDTNTVVKWLEREGWVVVLPTPKPECGELERPVRNGVSIDSLGNTVQAWKIVDMFSDYTNEDGVIITKNEQETEYLANKQAEYQESKIKEVTTTIDTLIQSKIDEYNKANGVMFADINSIFKYTADINYTHYNFCNAITLWNIAVWEKARTIQVEVFLGNRGEPTTEELLAELPVLTY